MIFIETSTPRAEPNRVCLPGGPIEAAPNLIERSTDAENVFLSGLRDRTEEHPEPTGAEPIAVEKFVRLVFIRLVCRFGLQGLPIVPTDSTGALFLLLWLITDRLSVAVRTKGAA